MLAPPIKAPACPSSPCPWDKLFRGFYDRHDPVIRYVLALACRCGFTLGLNGGGGDGIENESKRQKCRYAAGLGSERSTNTLSPFKTNIACISHLFVGGTQSSWGQVPYLPIQGREKRFPSIGNDSRFSISCRRRHRR